VDSSCFLDTNIFVRYLAGDHEQQTPIATRIIEAIEEGRLMADTSDTVIFETIFTMTSWYKAERSDLANGLAAILSLNGIRLPTKRHVLDALELWVSFRRLSFADAYHLVLTSNTGHKTIASFDKGMDRCLPGVTRIEEFP
jgi:predicted nucleic acid-binding protein